MLTTMVLPKYSFPPSRDTYEMSDVIAVARKLLLLREHHPLAIAVAAYYFANAHLGPHDIRNICMNPANQIFKTFRDLYPEQFHVYEPGRTLEHPPRPPIPGQTVHFTASVLGVPETLRTGIPELNKAAAKEVLALLGIPPPRTKKGRKTKRKSGRKKTKTEGKEEERKKTGWWSTANCGTDAGGRDKWVGVREPYQWYLPNERDHFWEQAEDGVLPCNRDTPSFPSPTGWWSIVPGGRNEGHGVREPYNKHLWDMTDWEQDKS